MQAPRPSSRSHQHDAYLSTHNRSSPNHATHAPPPQAAQSDVILAALAALFALVAAACGSDDDDADAQPEPAPEETQEVEEPDPDESADEPDPEPEAEADDTEAEPEAPAADPVTVWIIEDSSEAAGITFPSVRAGVDARVSRINAEGGLGAAGHEVRVEVCVTDFDPNAAAQCARDAAADPSAIAVAASVSGSGDAYLPILEEAGLANVGTTAFAQADASSPVSFPTMGGLIAATGCQAEPDP